MVNNTILYDYGGVLKMSRGFGKKFKFLVFLGGETKKRLLKVTNMNRFEFSKLVPIITESEFRAVQKEKKKRSNIVSDGDGTHRSSKKYSSKKNKKS